MLKIRLVRWLPAIIAIALVVAPLSSAGCGFAHGGCQE